MEKKISIKPIPFERSTSVYSQWHIEELELRGFLITSNIGMKSWFNALYASSEKHADKIFDPDRHDESLSYDIFIESTGIDPNKYWWQLSAAVVKDACGLLEVFLEESAHEVLMRRRARLTKMGTEDSWNWPDCQAFYESYLDLAVRPPHILDVLWMRNKLTHLRDELRTPEGLKEFTDCLERLGIGGPPSADELALGITDHEPYAIRGVHLTQAQTWRILNLIRAHVDYLGEALHAYVYGVRTSAPLDAVAAGQPIATIPKFNFNKYLTWTAP